MEENPYKKLYQFFRQLKLFFYKRRELILRADDIPSGVFYLKSGYVRLYSLSKEGEELTLIIFRPHDIFPLMWAINNAPNPYYLEALTKAELWRAPKQIFVSFLKTNPDELYILASRILLRMEGLFTRMEYLTFGNAYIKVASIILICAERFGKKEGETVVVQVPITHRDIASLTGMTRETVSVEMKRLEKKGIIGHKRKWLEVYDMRRLKKESLLGNG